MADSKSSRKPLGLSFKKNSDENKSNRDGKKAKKHKRQQSDLSDMHVVVDSSVAGQEQQPSTGEVATVSTATPEVEELVMPQPEPEDNEDGTKPKPKKKSRLRSLSFGRKKKAVSKRESASSVESETSSSLEAGAVTGEADVKNDEETQAGTRKTNANGDSGLDEEKEDVVVGDNEDTTAVEHLPMSNASSLTVVSQLSLKTNSPLLRQEKTEPESQETWDRAEEIDISEIGDEFYSLPDDDEVCPQIEIPPDTDIAEGIPRPSDLLTELKDIENSSENSIADTIYAILQHLKAVAFGSERYRVSHVVEITSETYKLCVIALDQSFAKFEGLFNFLLNQAEETTRKIVMYFLASLIKRYPHCFKVCKVKRKKTKSALKPTEVATQPAKKDTVF